MNKLEMQKLQLEINELKKKWYQKPPYLNVILSFVIIALTGFLMHFISIIGDIKGERLKLERQELKNDIFDFTQEKSMIINEISFLRSNSSQLKDSLISLSSEKLRLSKKLIDQYTIFEKYKYSQLKKENNQSEILKYYKSKLDSLKNIIEKEPIYLIDENGNFITTESGERIILENP